MSNIDNVIAGAAAGVLVTAIFHPLEVAELQLQAEQVRGATVRDALRAVVRSGGIPALFTAIRPGLACAALGFGVYFGCYGYFKQLAVAAVGPDVPAFAPNLLAAATAGCLTSVANNPLMVIKTRIILSLPVDLRSAKESKLSGVAGVVERPPVKLSTRVPSTVEVMRKVYNANGLRGFYAGLSPSLAGNAEAALHMALYEVIKKSIVQTPGAMLPPSATYSALTAGSGFAKIISATLAYPLAPVRTMLMNQKDGERKIGAIRCAKQLFASQGVRGFYRGLTASLAKQVVPMAFMFGLVEIIRDGLSAARWLIHEERLQF